MFAKNYLINNDRWSPLSDIMNQDYDHTIPYMLHVNEVGRGKLRFTHRVETPTEDEVGREYNSYAEINIPVDQGDHIYMKAMYGEINVEVRENL